MRHIHSITSAAVGSMIGMTAVMGTAQAADWPAQTIAMIVPYAAGGTTDVSVRQLARMAEAELGQPIVVENRPGGSGTNAMRAVASANPDGYTLIATTSSPSFVTPALRDTGYDPLGDFVSIMNYSGPYHGVLVPAEAPYDTLDQLIEAAKTDGTVTYGTAGAMGGAHLAFEKLAKETGAKLQHVPFDGASSATAAVLGDHVDVALVPAYRDLVQDGQLKLLAVLDPEADPDFVDVPTLRDAGYDVEFPSMVGVMAPAGTAPEIVQKLETVFMQIAETEEFAQFMTKLNQPVRIMSGEEMAETIAANLESYRAIGESMGQSQ
ncbi:MAG: Bug family tripartite tricarboxylate transporter substrate binding protein [Paracoccus sp. (in: a-proteobacteria)]|uniref:Bug family tripartite tricarboxylate transporter substrate binding protein n=1 Tax=Paracoccus sp. TaxID=267 RepID=UPI002E8A2D3A|nr:tripartite tricarboxylate transporter substrate binding protein [Pseudomonadota bacterium]